MNIEEIRRLSLEYAKGHVKTGPTFRTPKKKRNRLPLTYAEWFALSLAGKTRRGPPKMRKVKEHKPDSPPFPLHDRYRPSIPDAYRDPNLLPWE